MAITIENLDVPDLPYTWTGDYALTRSFEPDPNKKLSLTPKMAYNPQRLIAAGLASVTLNQGVPYGRTVGDDGYILPKHQSVFLEQQYLQDATGGSKPLESYTKDEIRRGVRNEHDNKPRGIITSGAQEPRYERDPWCLVNYFTPNPYVRQPHYTWVAECWAEVMNEDPNVFYLGPYDGCLIANPYDSAAVWRLALSSPEAAFNYVKSREYSFCPYINAGLYRYHDCIVNQYYRSPTDLNDRMGELQLTLEVMRLALEHIKTTFGFDRKLMVFVFLSGAEFVSYSGQGYSQFTKRNVPAGGYYENYKFPTYSFGFQLELAQSTFDSPAARYYCGWDDTNLHGWNPDVVAPDFIREDGFPMSKYYGGGASRGVVNAPFKNDKLFGFPPAPFGFEDSAPVSAEMHQIKKAHAGSVSTWARHRPDAGAPWCSLTSSYVYERWLEKNPYVRVAKNQAGNKFWLRVSKFGGGGPQRFNLDVDLLGNGSLIATLSGQYACEKNVPKNYLLTVS